MSKFRRIMLLVAIVAGSFAGLGIVGVDTPADAYYCGKLDRACAAVCDVAYRLGFQCID